jgi:hypothetical protein
LAQDEKPGLRCGEAGGGGGLEGRFILSLMTDRKKKKQIRDGWDAYKESADPDIKPYIGSDPRFENDIEVLPLAGRRSHCLVDTKNGDRKATDLQLPWKPRRQIPGIQFHMMKKPN